MDDTTIGAAFAGAVSAHRDRPFLAVPANAARGYLPAGFEISYGEAGRTVAELAALYRAAGYGLGHRVATLLENHPDHILHKLALNSLGACLVPINPDYRAPETAYPIEHSQPDLVVTLGNREGQVREALAKSAHRPEVIVSERFASSLAKGRRPAEDGAPEPGTPASVLYTSGTTGRPKGLILSHGYELAVGARYASLGGVALLHPGQDRLYNRCRSITPTRACSRCSAPSCRAVARSSPTASIPGAGGARSPRPGRRSCITSASSLPCCTASPWTRRRERTGFPLIEVWA